MSRVPPRSSREVEQALHHFGLRLLRHGAGHDIWGPSASGGTVSVPRARQPGELPGNTVRRLLREAGVPIADALTFWGIRPR